MSRSLGALTLAGAALLATPAGSLGAELSHTDVEQPAFTLQDLSGNSVALQDFAGRPVLVHFFATWCEPCREEVPALARLRARTPGAAVLAISVAENGQGVSRFFARTPTGFHVLLDLDRAVAKSWDITTLPTTYILDAGLQPRRRVEADYPWDTVDVAANGELTIHPSGNNQPTSE